MQIVGGRWEVCLGDGSCVLSFLSFPFAFFNLRVTGQIRSLGPGLAPFPADARPGPGRSPPPLRHADPGLASPRPTPANLHASAFAF